MFVKKTMKQILVLFSLLFFCSCAKEYIEGEGPVINDQTLDIKSFSKLSVDGPFEIHLTQGEAQSVTITSEQNIIDRTNKVVKEDKWNIHLQDGEYKNIAPKLNITISQLSNLEVRGGATVYMSSWNTNNKEISLLTEAGKLVTESPFVAKNVRINMNNGANFTLPKMATDSVFIVGDNIEIASITGTANYLNIQHQGHGRINTTGLKADSVYVNLTDGSKVNVYVNKYLDVTINNFGRVGYYGEPEEVKQNISGTGSLNHYN